MIRSATAAAAALALALLAPPAAGAARTVPQGFFGTNWDGEIVLSPPTVQDPEWSRMATTGAESARTAFDWAHAQPTRDGDFRWDRTDHVVTLASEHGLELLPYVLRAPGWAQKYKASFSPPKRNADYVRFLRALIHRYGPNGSFWKLHPELPLKPLRAWQIWNEPSKRYQWTIPKKKDFAPGYGSLLRASYKAIRKADPGAKVVMAGLPDFSYLDLRHLYEKGNIRGHYDIAAVHPYTHTEHGVQKIVGHFKNVLRREHDAKRPVWVTEMGLPASKGKANNGDPLQTTDQGMADFLRESYGDLMAKLGTKKYGVKRVYWYTWASIYRGDGEIFNWSGLLHYDDGKGTVSPKPAYDVYRDMARQAEGCVKAETGACEQPG